MARQQKFIAATRVVQGLAGIALMLGVWWLLTVPFSAPGAMGQRFAPGPSLLTLISLLQGGEIWIHIAVSLQSVSRLACCWAPLRALTPHYRRRFSFYG
jgi:ABC-type nitrate/sulfonate/bicarbonate transport system permease component